MSKLEKAVSEIVDEMRQMPDRGEVADYIPELAGVDPKSFGLVVIDAAGNVVAGGDGDVPFSIQSISKVFTLTLALGKIGNRLWERVGREPSGSPFNSIVQLERERGIPRNPFINAGAIAVTDVDPFRASAARGAGRDPALHAVPGRRPHDCHRCRRWPLPSNAPAIATPRSPTT